MSNGPVQPVIIVKKKSGHGGHHGGAWKVAYADFVTAMMAFFLVMWLVSQSKPVRAGVGGYFRDPVAFAEGGRGVLPGADSLEEPKPQAPAAPTDTSEEIERRQLEAAVLHIKEGLEQVPAFQELRDQVEYTITPEGLRIDLIEREESTFFDSGSAKMKSETERILAVIAQELSALDHDVVLEGHTDSQPYASAQYSNWELSSDRANAARRVMEHAGLKPRLVTAVRGLADRQLRFPENPRDSRNRRVSVLVKSPLLKGQETGKVVSKAEPVPPVPPVEPQPSAEQVADAVQHAITPPRAH
jgi:chemotaxis protein MotB